MSYKMVRNVCVFQDWLFKLTMQQQSVLVLACRGPDGLGKFHLVKPIIARYRASVLKAAYLGRPMRVDEFDDTTFMSLEKFSDRSNWDDLVDTFFDHCDEIPHHSYMHLMHGAQIIAYKHPDLIFRERWSFFYSSCCRDLHLNPETEVQLDSRLSDWAQANWDDAEQATLRLGVK